MKKKSLLKLLIAYFLIVFFGAFVNYPLIALIALPLFAGGIAWMIYILLRSPVLDDSKRNLSSGLIVAAVLLMAATIFSAINTLMSYFGTREYILGETGHPWASYILPAAFAILGAICMIAGTRIRTGWKLTSIVFGSLVLIAPFLSLLVFWLFHNLLGR